MKKMTQTSQIQIAGYVRPIAKDKSGNVIQTAIETEDFENFIVADNHIGHEILKLVGKKVRANGQIAGEYFDGSEIISIKNYKIME